MRQIAILGKDTLRHARGAARNMVETYRVVVHRGVALERRAVSAGIGFVGTRLGTDGQVLASLGRMNRDITGFAATVVDGAAVQANAFVDGVARIAGQAVASGLGAVPVRSRGTIRTIALPVVKPVRGLSVRVADASRRVLRLVGPKPRAAAGARAKRVARKARARRAK